MVIKGGRDEERTTEGEEKNAEGQKKMFVSDKEKKKKEVKFYSGIKRENKR